MQLSIRRIPKSLRNQLIIFLIILLISLFYTCLKSIPTDSDFESVGLGANILDIGDRKFYLNFDTNHYGYGDVKGGILYPFVLKIISKFTNIFNYDERSGLWNFLVISLTSIISIINLFLIDISAKNIFGTKIARIANWLYIACPYTLFYALSGGLTMYIILGTTLTTYFITNSSVFRKDRAGNKYNETNFYLFFSIIYLSLLRPTGTIFGITLILLFNFCCFLKIYSGNINVSKRQIYVGLFLMTISILFCLYKLIEYIPYLSFSLDSFTFEKGSYFGVDRELMRERLSNSSLTIMNLKNNLYYFFWKLSDFLGGISDIRDTHRDLTTKPLFPFIMRVLTGMFYIYPVNLLSFGGIFTYRKRILDSGLFIILISSIIVISPSILGVAMSRYLIMVYPPFIICSASILSLLIDQGKVLKENKY